jgi:hypothetical protein
MATTKIKATESALASLLKAGETPVVYFECDLNMKVVKREVWAFLNSQQVTEFLTLCEDDGKEGVKDFQVYSAYVEVTAVKPMAVGKIDAYGQDRAWERNLKTAIQADPEAFLIDLTASKATPATKGAAANKANVKKRVKSPAARKAAGVKTADETLTEKLEESVKQIGRRKPTAAGAARKAAATKAPAKAAPAKRTVAKKAMPTTTTAPKPRAAAVRKAAVAKKAAPVKQTAAAPKPQPRRVPRKRVN